MARWIYRVTPARTDIASGPSDDEAEAIAEHLDYQRALKGAGILIMAGPTDVAEDQWGVTLFEAPDEESARAVLETDPAVARGVLHGSLYPYAVGGATPTP